MQMAYGVIWHNDTIVAEEIISAVNDVYIVHVCNHHAEREGLAQSSQVPIKSRNAMSPSLCSCSPCTINISAILVVTL